jgi:hypothetical protein
MNETENRPANVLEDYVERFLDTVDQRWASIANRPSLMVFWMMGISVLIILVTPVLLVGFQWVVNLFTENPKDIVVVNMLFEAFVVGLVFLFSIGLLFFLRSKAPSLTYIIIFISFILTILATSMFGVTANSCLSDLKCDTSKFLAAMSIAFLLSMVSYIFLRVVQMDPSPFGLPYLAVSVWESLLWLWQSYNNVGIKPFWPGVFLLIFSILWLVVYGAGAKKPDGKVIPPNRWGT